MKFVRFRDQSGYVRTGTWKDSHINSSGKTYQFEEIDILPPTEPTKIICVGTNYVEHFLESGYDYPDDLPDRPQFFIKTPNTVTGHKDTVTLPVPGTKRKNSESIGEIEVGKGRIDYEAELGVVISKQAKNVHKENAFEFIRGFTCLNDISNRDDQFSEQNWVRGKSFDNSAPIGPVIATPDLVPENPTITLRINGEKKQDSSEDEMIFSVPEVLEEITKFMTLEPGDIIAMGTTSGVGPLKDGDTVEIEIEGVGKLEHYVREE